MNQKLQQIDCPVCGSPIFFNVNNLLMGESFSCSSCKSMISLSTSSTRVVEQAMIKYEKLSITQNSNK